jgi:hypothetical protein
MRCHDRTRVHARSRAKRVGCGYQETLRAIGNPDYGRADMRQARIFQPVAQRAPGPTGLPYLGCSPGSNPISCGTRALAGFMRQAALCSAALDANARSCRRQGLPGLSRRWHPRPSCALHGARHSDGEAGSGLRRRGEQERRPGCLDAAGARGRTPGRPGGRPSAQRPRAIRGTDSSPGSSSVPGSGWRPGPERGCGCPARPCPVCRHAE